MGSTALLAAMLIALIVGFKNGSVNAGDFALVLTLSVSFMWSVYNIGTQMQNFSKAAGFKNFKELIELYKNVKNKLWLVCDKLALTRIL